MEQVFSRWHTVSSGEADCFGRLRPGALFRLLQDLAVLQSNENGYGRTMNRERGLCWVVSRMRVEFQNLPRHGQVLELRTWPAPQSRIMFPRHYDVRDRAGNTLVRASAAWLLMEERRRSMVLPQRSGVEIPGVILGTECELPGPLREWEYDRQDWRTVQFSELDTNDHMNNTCYLDWMEDLLPRDFHQGNGLQSLQINYLHELRYGEEVSLDWQFCHGELRLLGGVEGEARFRLEASFTPTGNSKTVP